MLDNDTKRRIDTARDILVGKVPDPKSQVEQITVALIYKFMDDMDMEAIELGGEASFFTGEYAKYAWRELFKPAIGGTERLLLYSEAIVQMNINPHLPQLFRDIFKNAYLPYRDPETLTMFLKIIQEFKYDHSERLGDAFEYLLSVLGSQGDAGQFRTPRHIIDFMAAVIQPQKHETIGDPACGTAGFLIASYKHILSENKGQLTPSERLTLAKNLIGYDISPDMVRLSLVNLYLHGFRTPLVYEYDSLSSQEKWGEYFDVILANPPFMTPKGGIKPHNRFGVQSNRAEVLFVDYIAEHLKPDGRAAIIVPEGIIFQGGTAYKALRRMLIEEGYLYAVASLPAGIFQPYSGVKTSILFIDKSMAKRTDKLLFVKINDEGFGLGAQRRAQTANDLPEVLQILSDYKRALHSNTPFETDSPLAIVVEKAAIAKNGAYNLSADRYKVVDTEGVAKFDMVRLGDVAKFEYGFTTVALNAGNARFVRITDIDESGFLKKAEPKFIELTEEAKKYLLAKNDLLVARTGATYGKTMIFNEEYDAVFASFLIRIKLEPQKVLPEYYWSFTKTDYYWNQAKDLVTGGGQPQFNANVLKEITFPLPPLSIQRQIVSKIESYQRIIDGAKQVVNNYKPMIEVDAAWEMVELGEVLTKVNESIDPQKSEGIVNYIGLENIESQTGTLVGDYEVEIKEIKSIKTQFKRGDILYGKLRPNLNKVWLAQFDGICSTDIFVLREKSNISNSAFYSSFFINDKFNQEVMNGLKGAQLPRVGFEHFSQIQIPLPPLSIQAEIVAAIELEQSYVNGNKALIGLMEEKIKGVIGQVWAV